MRSVLDKIHGNVLDSTLQAKLRKVADIMDDFRAKNNALDEYALKKSVKLLKQLQQITGIIHQNPFWICLVLPEKISIR